MEDQKPSDTSVESKTEPVPESKPETKEEEKSETTPTEETKNDITTENKQEVTNEKQPEREQTEAQPTEEPKKEQASENKQEKQPELEKRVEIHNDDDSYEDIDDDAVENIEDLKLKVPEDHENSLPDYEKANLDEKISNLKLDDSSKTENKDGKKSTNSLEPTKKGKFYQHDNRDDGKKSEKKEHESKNEKWSHDKYDHKTGSRTRNNPRQNQDKTKTKSTDQKKGLPIQEYLEQNQKQEIVDNKPKEHKTPRTNQAPRQSKDDSNKKQNYPKRDLNMDAPTPVSDLKSRLDFSTRIPTIVDDLFLDTNRGQQNYNRQNSGQNRYQNNQNSNRQNQKFDKPFDKNEKLDIVITKDFKTSTRQVTLNSGNNFNNRSNDGRQNRDTYSAYMQHGQRGGYHNNQQRRNMYDNNQQSYDDNFHPYMAYVDSDILANYADNSDYSQVRTQTFNNRNFGNVNNNSVNAYPGGSGGGVSSNGGLNSSNKHPQRAITRSNYQN
ncbi:unnamed protein product [Brachionus calyciflorus]|uniref:Uncharacterized protein n=1 Tax=Brachionus calyciflorus TaxID=104777 RepID=A0A813TVD4_9BILA|nr:unnamed protein product [Brachionus calyciflorus]